MMNRHGHAKDGDTLGRNRHPQTGSLGTAFVPCVCLSSAKRDEYVLVGKAPWKQCARYR